MDPPRWQQIEDILQAALDIGPSKRSAFLGEACGDDASLRREVDDLLGREAAAAVLSEPALRLRPARLHPGRRVGHYVIERHLGSGGMGDVYEARDEVLQRIVALKALSPELTSSAGRVQRFEQEALTVSRLNHPNIITIFEILEDTGEHFIVTEHVEGTTLREVLQSRALTLEEALDIIIQIAGALKAAHTAWIIHRDIKPENVMVRSDGLVKVLDFGIAKLTEDRDPESNADSGSAPARPGETIPGAILGTAKYMSPEQARGDPLDGRSDIYSLGLVFREMLASQRAPRNLQPVLDRMLRPDRNERYPSVAELLEDLRLVRWRLENRRARTLLGISGTAAVVAVALVAIAAPLSMNERWEEQVLRDGHSAAARQVIFSPDGRRLLSCGEDGQLILWDFARRQRIATRTHRANHLAFSPDGTWFASGGVDGRVNIWDSTTFRLTRVLETGPGPITALSASPGGGGLLLGTMQDGQLWDTRHWKRIRSWPAGTSHGTFVFWPHAKLAAAEPWSVVDVSTARPQLASPAPDGYNWVTISQDGSRAASVGPLGDVSFFRVSETRSGIERTASRHAHQDHGRSIAFSPDGRLVASAAEDILLWDAETKKKIARFESSAIVWSLAFSPDGTWLVSSHGDGAILIWDVAERECVANLSEHSGAVRAVAIAADGKHVVSAGEDRTIIVWDSRRRQKAAVLAGHRNRVTSLSIAGRNTIISADQSGEVILWDSATRRPRVRIPNPQPGASYCVAASPSQDSVLSSHGLYGMDGRAIFAYRSDPNWTFGSVYGGAFLDAGDRIALVTDTGSIVLLSTKRREIISSRQVSSVPQIAVSVSPDGKSIATGDDAGIIRLWTDSLEPVAVLGRHAARVKSVAFSPDGSVVASAGDDKMIALWDVKRRRLRGQVGTHASPIYSIAFSSDGRRLISGEHDRTVRVYTRHRTLFGFPIDSVSAAMQPQ